MADPTLESRYGRPPYKPAFDQLKRAAFASIEFPVTNVEIHGSIRDHIHIYPHSKGGAPEKLGRNLYTISMDANFQNTFRKYPAALWPLSLRQLRGIFEEQTTDDLVIPTIGTIKAYCRNWSQKMEAKIRSGEMARFEFVEDQDATTLEQELAKVSTASLQAAVSNFDASKALADFQNDKTTESIFDAISDAANFVLSFADLAELTGNLVSAKLMALNDLASQFDRTKFGKDPTNEPVIHAVKELIDTIRKIMEDQKARFRSIEFFQVPITMPMNQISLRLYGTTERTIELMQLNAVPDVFRVVAGTRIRFYPPEDGVDNAIQTVRIGA